MGVVVLAVAVVREGLEPEPAFRLQQGLLTPLLLALVDLAQPQMGPLVQFRCLAQLLLLVAGLEAEVLGL